MNEKAANAQRKSWLTIAFKIWICNYLRFTAISSTAIKFKFRKRQFNSDVPNIQQSQVCHIIQSWTLDTEIKRFREAFFFTVFLCEWIMSYKLNFIQYRHFYHPLTDNSKTLLIDQPFHTKVRWMNPGVVTTYFFICSQEDVFICMDRKSSEKWVMKEEDPNVVQNPNRSSGRIPFSVANNLIEE